MAKSITIELKYQYLISNLQLFTKFIIYNIQLNIRRTSTSYVQISNNIKHNSILKFKKTFTKNFVCLFDPANIWNGLNDFDGTFTDT